MIFIAKKVQEEKKEEEEKGEKEKQRYMWSTKPKMLTIQPSLAKVC